MNLTMSFVFAALLVLIGAPQPLLNNNADTIVACAEDAGTLAFAEAMENLDDRLTGFFTLALAVTAPHCSLAKTRRIAGLQRSNTLDISSRNRKPWKCWE